eukprot:15356187-Ditylum_brightwellii.AAC.1
MLCQADGQLKQLLGWWMAPPEEWKGRFDRDQCRVYHKLDAMWTKHEVHITTRQHHNCSPPSAVSQLLPYTVPISDVKLTPERFQFHCPSEKRQINQETVSPQTTFEEYVALLDTWEQDIIQGVEFVEEEDNL